MSSGDSWGVHTLLPLEAQAMLRRAAKEPEKDRQEAIDKVVYALKLAHGDCFRKERRK